MSHNMKEECDALREENRMLKDDGPGTPRGRLNVVADVAEQLGHDGLRSDKTPEETVIEYALQAQEFERVLRLIPYLTKHQERTGYNPYCAKCFAQKVIEDWEKKQR